MYCMRCIPSINSASLFNQNQQPISTQKTVTDDMVKFALETFHEAVNQSNPTMLLNFSKNCVDKFLSCLKGRQENLTCSELLYIKF